MTFTRGSGTPKKASLGRVLRDARRNAGLTQQEIADMLDISLWSYNRIENGRRTFTTAWISKLPMAVRMPLIRMFTEQYESKIRVMQRLSHEPAPTQLSA